MNLGKRADLELLLTAIREPDEETALAAYATWRARYQVDDMDVHAMKLAPRLVLRLHALSVEDKETRRLEGIGRYLLLQGHVQIEGARAAATVLARAAVEVVAVKGVMIREAGLISAYERPMVDADLVLARPSQSVEAAKALRRSGWEEGTALEHATTYKKGRAELDLHRFAVRQDKLFAIDSVWRKTSDREAVPYSLLELTPSLILTCLHGLRTDGGAIWVFDAEALVKSERVRWDGVLAYAAAKKLVLAFETALRRVRGVPPDVMQALGQMPASHIEALELRHMTTKFDRLGDRAARLLSRLRERSEKVDVRVHEEEPGMRWDPRWEKEWQ